MIELFVEGEVIKQKITQNMTIEDLKLRFKAFQRRIQYSKDELLKAQDTLISFKDILTKAGIDYTKW